MLYLIPVFSIGDTCTGFSASLLAKRIISLTSAVGGRLATITSLAYTFGLSPKQINIIFTYMNTDAKLSTLPEP
jgi:hypothetical protein